MSESFITSPFAAAREIAQCYEEIGEKDAQIERLKATLEKITDHGAAAEWMRVLKERDAEIELHKALHVRAADALEISKPGDSLVYNELIADLRKAAE